MSLRYIIDGNNCLHHPDFTYPKNTPDPRLVLPYFILKHGLTGSKRNKVVIIFDGYPRTPELVKSPADNL